ncbi:MAG: SNF2-related protein, partial [Opitutaceae bacterium]
MLRLFLPPNLAAAAPRDAIAVKVELDLSTAPAAEVMPALVLLQRWSASPTPPKLIQLTRARLRELVAALRGQPVFFWINGPTAPIAWQGDALAGVSVFINAAGAAAKTVTTIPAPIARRTSSQTDSTPLVVDGSEHFLALTLPSRERSNYAAALELVKACGFVLEPSNRKWWLRDRHKALNFLAAHGTRLRESFGAEFTANFQKNTAHFRPTEVITEATETGDTYAVTVALRAGSAEDAQIREAVSANRGYLESEGKVYLLEATQLSRFNEAQRLLAGEPGGNLATRRTHRVNAARVAEAQEILEQLSPGFQPPETWRARSEALRNLSALAPAPLPAPFDAQLRSYQRLGVAWLWHLHRHGLAGILADEMGLGKTLQALGLLSCVQENAPMASGPRGSSTDRRVKTAAIKSPSLVIAPASLLENWRREALRFTPHLRTFVHHGENRLASSADFAGVDLIVTSYGTLARDQELFTSLEFSCVIADEAQHIKNRRSQNAAALRALRARGRFLLTGTPLENSLDD